MERRNFVRLFASLFAFGLGSKATFAKPKVSEPSPVNREIIKVNGRISYFLNGKLHREDGPAVEDEKSKKWYLNGKLHRDDGPAVEFSYGDKYWFNNDLLHREGGPAIEFPCGSKFWFINGQLHREDGPAIEYADGRTEWHLNEINWRIENV